MKILNKTVNKATVVSEFPPKKKTKQLYSRQVEQTGIQWYSHSTLLHNNFCFQVQTRQVGLTGRCFRANNYERMTSRHKRDASRQDQLECIYTVSDLQDVTKLAGSCLRRKVTV